MRVWRGWSTGANSQPHRHADVDGLKQVNDPKTCAAMRCYSAARCCSRLPQRGYRAASAATSLRLLPGSGRRARGRGAPGGTGLALHNAANPKNGAPVTRVSTAVNPASLAGMLNKADANIVPGQTRARVV